MVSTQTQQDSPPWRPPQPAQHPHPPLVKHPQRIFPGAPSGVIGGVCAGLAYTLGVNVFWVRLIACVLIPFMVSPILYPLLLVILPMAGKDRLELPHLGGAPAYSGPATWMTSQATTRSSSKKPTVQQTLTPQSNHLVTDITLMLVGTAVLCITFALYVAMYRTVLASALLWFFTVLCLLVGYILAWWNIGRVKVNWLMCSLGGSYVVIGMLPVLLSIFRIWDLISGFMVVAVVLLLLGVLLFPLWVNLRNALLASEFDRVRMNERAEVAAHLHDSVLQTLTLIQSHSGDGAYVARLARREERQLRSWLYPEQKARGCSVKQFVEQVVGEVEDALDVNIETVIVGDRDAGPRGTTMQSLMREACMNAAKHGAAPISVYVECGQQFEAYVKDHGPGFSLEQLDQVPADRHGIRNSLLKRARQAGGSVNIRKLAVGTEVAIMVPWQDESPSENSGGGHHD